MDCIIMEKTKMDRGKGTLGMEIYGNKYVTLHVMNTK
jgi:hypothetical protein